MVVFFFFFLIVIKAFYMSKLTEICVGFICFSHLETENTGLGAFWCLRIIVKNNILNRLSDYSAGIRGGWRLYDLYKDREREHENFDST